MARGVNKVILIGNMGKDPESRFLPSGGAVCNATIATNESWKDKTTGEQKERTEWHNVVFYGKLAEIVAQYLTKGSQVYIEGSIRTRKWQDKEGHDRYTTEIIADQMQMLGGKRDGAGNSNSGRDESERPQPGRHTGGGRATAPASADKNFEDDDIPF